MRRLAAPLLMLLLLAAGDAALALRPGGVAPQGPELVGVDQDGRPIRRSELGAAEPQPDGSCISRLARDFGAVVPCPPARRASEPPPARSQARGAQPG